MKNNYMKAFRSLEFNIPIRSNITSSTSFQFIILQQFQVVWRKCITYTSSEVFCLSRTAILSHVHKMIVFIQACLQNISPNLPTNFLIYVKYHNFGEHPMQSSHTNILNLPLSKTGQRCIPYHYQNLLNNFQCHIKPLS